MKLVIDFAKLEYRKPKRALDIFADFFLDPLQDIVSVTPHIPPFEYKRIGIDRFLPKIKDMSYVELGRTICFDEAHANRILIKHRTRLSVYSFLSFTLHLLFLLSAALLAGAGVYQFYLTAFATAMNIPLFVALSGILTLGLPIVIAIFSLRISAILIDRHFADTLTLISCTYLLIILEKEISLADPEARRDILARMATFRKNIVLLSLMFARKDAWSIAHFKQMENFVHERERWIVAPQIQTLADLRKDFGDFLEILVTGEYGRFQWVVPDEQSTPEPVEQKPIERLARFLASVLPFVLLIVLFIFPAQVKAIGFDNNIVTLFLLAWLLLAIDSGLKLGMVERASSFAKTIKDLR